MTTVDLGGSWSVREALGDTWQWFVDQPVTARNNAGAVAGAAALAPGWLPARVPGAVIGDLVRAGELPSPYAGRNSRAAEWVSTRSWVYRRTFEVAPLPDGSRAALCFDGVDPGGAVYVDGTLVGRVGGLYWAARFDVTALVADGGSHRLAVVVDPAPVTEPQVGRTERVRVHAPRMGYGWDFCPRLVHQGIWRGVRLEIGVGQLEDVSVRPAVSPHLAAATVEVSGRVSGAVADAVMEVRLDGEVVAAGPLSVGADGSLTGSVVVPEPALWWPQGLGDQPLYEVVVRAGDAVRRVVTGFRHAVLAPNAGASLGALPYTAVVNGRRVELTGWNWAPADALYGEITDAKVEHLVELARRTGARLLRVWGGGLIETPSFYAACDRAGLFVWQEFSQSSSGMQSAPADDPAFVEHLRAEAAAVVPGRTQHPSLLLWGGGNELEDDVGLLSDDRSPALAALRDEVARLDPGRSWLPTSPTGPRFHFRDGGHDVHGPWEHQGLTAHYTLYNGGSALAHTEFGVEGMANRRLWTALVPPDDRWPVGRGNPVYRHLGDWWNNATLVQECFGGRLGTPGAFRRASQFLQASGLAYAVEADRRRWPRSSIVLPWQLAESYPNAWCTAVVDHAGEPKPAYHAVARAYRAERVTARLARLAFGREPVAVEAWLWSSPGRAGGGTVTARLLDVSGVVLAEERWPVADPVDTPRPAGRLVVDAPPPDTLVLAELIWSDADGRLVDRECLPLSTASDLTPLLDLEPATIWFHVERRGESVEVAHTAGPAVIGLQLSDDRPPESTGWALVDGDPRPLLPGERRTFTVEWRHDTGPRRLLLESWNTEPVVLEDV
ncbi:glycosyl hydrolase 2 galactose-binding domain-containing protein [Jiangella muralis]|uniref:glycosyl hydrolase 2 galactose-binding domain-containing protein n=1 Tax=Jiangella muralis TaxID=702383 RepID=UPI00069CECFB|nr:sugar-binding domain-containing protein [Jiangella muralis]